MQNTHPAARFFSASHPISEYVDISFTGVSDNILTASVLASSAFVEDPVSGRLHSGFCTLVLDTVMGGTVMGEIGEIRPIATVELTTRHRRRPIAGEKLLCRSKFEGQHNQMAHVSSQIFVEETGETLSTATAIFMLGTRAEPLGPRV